MTGLEKIFLAVASAILLSGGAAQSQARPARCELDFGPDADHRYSGPCLFDPRKPGGSFTLSRPDGKPILAHFNVVNLEITAVGVGAVSLNFAGGAGHDDYEEPFVRSKERPACWIQQVTKDPATVCVR